MGTDIHSIAQVRVDGEWKTVAVGIGGDPLDYNLFAMLADVRNGRGFAGIITTDHFPVIHERRGLPFELHVNDCNSVSVNASDLLMAWDYGGNPCEVKSGRRASYLGQDDNRIWMGDHSHSWCLLSEMQTFVEQVAVKHEAKIYGVVDREEYETAKKEGRRFQSWCGDITGQGVVKASEQDYAQRPDGVTHVHAEWTQNAMECSHLSEIRDALLSIAGKLNVAHDAVRYVYGFDS